MWSNKINSLPMIYGEINKEQLPRQNQGSQVTKKRKVQEQKKFNTGKYKQGADDQINHPTQKKWSNTIQMGS